jgi:hypothetical protein
MGRKRGGAARVVAKASQRAELMGTPAVEGLTTSTRCRATHDAPYTLRCVLEALHDVKPVTIPERPGFGMVQPKHRDKEGNEWTD